MKQLITALFCAFAITVLPAQAATVTLDLTENAPDFADRSLNNGDTVSDGPFSLTFQNIDANGRDEALLVGGSIILGRITGDLASVDLTFNIDTVIETYGIGVTDPGTFQITGRNGTSGSNSLQKTGANTFDMGTIPVFRAGETYTLTHTVTGASLAELNALGLSHPPSVTAVPLPASLPLLLAGFGAIALLRRRHPASQDGTAP
ncbi:VPLPA-CTERM sorting domain-containing protein [Roseobacter sp. A03A-229]